MLSQTQQLEVDTRANALTVKHALNASFVCVLCMCRRTCANAESDKLQLEADIQAYA